MSKRKIQNINDFPPSKKVARSDNNALLGSQPLPSNKYTWNDIINALGDKNKLKLNDFRFKHDNDPLLKSNAPSQMGHFIANQLNKLTGFNNVVTGGDHYWTGAYSPSQRMLVLNPSALSKEGEAVKTFSHEGTHAIDHLKMGIGSSVAIPLLAKLEKKQNNNLFDTSKDQNWYTQAQRILNDQNFSDSYKFIPSEKDTKEFNEFYQQLTQDAGYDSDENPSLSKIEEDLRKDENLQELLYQVETLQDMQSAFNYGNSNLIAEANKLPSNPQSFTDIYNNIKNIPFEQRSQDQTFHKPFTEFAAHIVENLDNPWNISNKPQKANYWQNNNEGRKFLKGITKGVYRNFQELDPDFSTKYPDANKNFLDRITQLRNYNKPKGQTEDAYKIHLYDKLPQLNPSYNLPQSNNTMPLHPFQGNAEYNAPHAQYNNVLPKNLPQLGSFSNDNEDDSWLSRMQENYQLPAGFDNNLAENNLNDDEYIESLQKKGFYQPTLEQLNLTIPNSNTNLITQSPPPMQPQNAPLDWRPHPVDNGYYLQTPYPRTPNPEY